MDAVTERMCEGKQNKNGAMSPDLSCQHAQRTNAFTHMLDTTFAFLGDDC